MSTLLECRGVDAGYNGTSVVRGFDLELESGTVVALLGPNGAGKTTTLLAMSGLLRPLAGTVHLRGEDITGLSTSKICRRGVVLVPDDRSLFTSLSVRENLEISRCKGGLDEQAVLAYFPRLVERLLVSAGKLSGGEQQMLAIGRALIRRPDVLLIDELSLGLAPLTVERLLPVLRQIADETGAAVLLVEQHVRLALQFADRAIVMVHGQVALSAPASELLNDIGRLEDAYLTGSMSSAVPT